MSIIQKSFFYISSLLACSIMALSTGCASGGFKLTRQYAGWLNSQNIILRVVLYLFGFVIFLITLLIDAVVFNTLDFWQGRISAGTYQFEHEEKTFVVQHEITPGTNLKRSTIQIKNAEQKLLQTCVLQETTTGEIELIVDGTLRTRVHDLQTIPVASFFDAKGTHTEDQTLWSVLTSPTTTLARK